MDLSSEHTVTLIPVDAEHGGIRLAVVLVFIIGWIAAYIILSALISGAGLNVVALLGGFAVAYGLTSVAERMLKRRWPSGRILKLDERGVSLVLRGQVQQAMMIGEDAVVNALLWRFETRRRSRVPKGWSVLALALERDETYLCVYTFMSPDQVRQFVDAEHFTVLKSAKDTPKSGAGRDDLLLAGEQRRLYLAEQQRWLNGAEMTRDDFQRYIDLLRQQFPGLLK